MSPQDLQEAYRLAWHRYSRLRTEETGFRPCLNSCTPLSPPWPEGARQIWGLSAAIGWETEHGHAMTRGDWGWFPFSYLVLAPAWGPDVAVAFLPDTEDWHIAKYVVLNQKEPGWMLPEIQWALTERRHI